MAPHLLTLPGEIRNRIYDFVFTEEDGVCYREDLKGVGWLCVYDEELDTYLAGYVKHYTPTKTVKLDDTNGLVKINPGRHVIVDQLQFVCHELRKETKGLVIRMNTIFFSPLNGGPPAKKCLKFIYSLPDKLQKLLRTLAIVNYPNNKFFDCTIDPVIAFGRSNPNTRIHLHDSMTIRPESMVAFAMICAKRTGRPVSLLTNLNLHGKVIVEGLVSQRTILSLKLCPIIDCPDNLRILPCRLPFNEAIFRARAIRDSRVTNVLPGIDGGLETLVACTKEFIEQGW